MAAFVLAPVVRQLRRLGLGQTGASLFTLGLVALLAVGVAGVLALQLASLSNNLPRYQTHLQGKVQAVRHLSLGPLGALGYLGLRLAPAPMDAQAGLPGAPDATPGEATTGQSPAARAGRRWNASTAATSREAAAPGQKSNCAPTFTRRARESPVGSSHELPVVP